MSDKYFIILTILLIGLAFWVISSQAEQRDRLYELCLNSGIKSEYECELDRAMLKTQDNLNNSIAIGTGIVAGSAMRR